jgi:hypothetical protein
MINPQYSNPEKDSDMKTLTKIERKMKTNKSKITYVIAGLLAAVFISAATPASAGNETITPQAPCPAILGSWQVVVSSGLPPFNELITFSSDGGIVEANNFPFYTLGLSAGPGHGTWDCGPHQQVVFTFYKLLFDPTGAAAGTLKVVGTINYSHHTDTWTSPADISICDNQGQNCFQIDHTESSASRIHAGQ